MLFERITSSKFLQPSKAFLPIVLTFFPILTFFNAKFPLNALFDTEVTLYVLPSTTTLSGTTILSVLAFETTYSTFLAEILVFVTLKVAFDVLSVTKSPV